MPGPVIESELNTLLSHIERVMKLNKWTAKDQTQCICLPPFNSSENGNISMENAVFWDIRALFILHRRHITSPLQSAISYFYIRFEVFTAVTTKNAIF
jgi:hypothetical protein